MLPSDSRTFPLGSRLRIAVTLRPSPSLTSNSSASPAPIICCTSASRSAPTGGSWCDFQRITKYPRLTCGRRASARCSSWSARSSVSPEAGGAGGRARREGAMRVGARSQLALDEVTRTELETLEKALDQRRRIRGHADVVVSAREDRAGTADGLGDPGGEPVVVDPERFVVALERTVEVLTVKENADLHGRLPGEKQTVNSLPR